MRWLNRKKISTKMFLTFGLIITFIVMAGGCAYLGFDANSKVTNQITMELIPNMKALNILSEQQAIIKSSERTLMSKYLLEKNRNNQFQYIADAYTKAEVAYKSYDTMQKTANEEAKWKTFGIHWENLKNGVNEFIEKNKTLETLPKGSKEYEDGYIQLSALTYGTNNENYILASADISAIIEINNNEITTANQTLSTYTFFAKWIIIIGIIFCSILSSIIGFLLTKSIDRILNRTTGKLSESVGFISAASAELSSASAQLAEGSSEQAASIQETSATMEETASMVKQNSENTKQALILCEKAESSSKSGSNQMIEMNSSMQEIRKSSDAIAKIIKVIDEIAFQTNILALNAAVEAARAGEAGAGFSVVAEEVRNLAGRSAKAAKDTAEIIEKNIELSRRGVDISKLVSQSLGEIHENTEKVSKLVSEITSASTEQSRGIEQIANAICQMEQVTQQNAAIAEESSASSQEMQAQTEELLSIVDDLTRFVKGEEHETENNNNNYNNVDKHRTQRKKLFRHVIPKHIANSLKSINGRHTENSPKSNDIKLTEKHSSKANIVTQEDDYEF